MRLALAAVAALSFSTAPAQAANLLVNGSFETGGLGPWFADYGSPQVSNAAAHSGTYSVAAEGNGSIRQNFAATPTSDIAELSFWAKRDGGPFDGYFLHYQDGSAGAGLALADGDDWVFFDVTANLAAGKKLTGFSIFGTSPGPTFLDDFKILASNSVPEPASWVMMIGGFALAGSRLRRRQVSFASA